MNLPQKKFNFIFIVYVFTNIFIINFLCNQFNNYAIATEEAGDHGKRGSYQMNLQRQANIELLTLLSHRECKKSLEKGANLKDILSEHRNFINSQGNIGKKFDFIGLRIPVGTYVNYSFDHADLTSACFFEGTKLSKSDFYDCILKNAFFDKVVLIDTVFSDCNMTNSSFIGADLSYKVHNCDLTKARFMFAYLDVKFTHCNMTKTSFEGADLKGCKIIQCDLTNASFRGANLDELIFEPTPGKLPYIPSMALANNLHLLTYKNTPNGLIELRQAFRKSGFKQQEREVTYAIKHTQISKCVFIEWLINYVAFELSCGWGMYPGRPIIAFLIIIPICNLLYLPAFSKNYSEGIWRYWPQECMKPKCKTQAREKLKRGTNVSWLGSIGYALYFSILSSFRIGWRELNVGTWISKLQFDEYLMYATGYARLISGIQSIVSVYLLALAILTYFSNIFDF